MSEFDSAELAAPRRPAKSDAAFRTISEVSEDLKVPQHVLRFWEGKFTQIKPLKRGGGRRYYRPEDVALLRRIRDLLYNDGYTIKGAQKHLREQMRGGAGDMAGAAPEEVRGIAMAPAHSQPPLMTPPLLDPLPFEGEVPALVEAVPSPSAAPAVSSVPPAFSASPALLPSLAPSQPVRPVAAGLAPDTLASAAPIAALPSLRLDRPARFTGQDRAELADLLSQLEGARSLLAQALAPTVQA